MGKGEKWKRNVERNTVVWVLVRRCVDAKVCIITDDADNDRRGAVKSELFTAPLLSLPVMPLAWQALAYSILFVLKPP